MVLKYVVEKVEKFLLPNFIKSVLEHQYCPVIFQVPIEIF